MPDDQQSLSSPWGDDPWDASDHEVTASTTMSRLRDRAGRVLATVVAVAMLLPVGAWAVDSLVFSRLADDVAEAVPSLADGVALVSRTGCDGGRGSGSGFATSIDDRPVVITNRHVVEDAAAVGVRTLDGRAGPAVDQVLLSVVDDVAVLVLAAPLDGELALGARPDLGDRVRLVGFPGARPVTSTGEVVDVDSRRLLLDLPADPGSSGAPLVDDDDRVVGQVVARTPDDRGVAIPADVVAAAVRDVVPAPAC